MYLFPVVILQVNRVYTGYRAPQLPPLFPFNPRADIMPGRRRADDSRPGRPRRGPSTVVTQRLINHRDQFAITLPLNYSVKNLSAS